MMRKTRRDILKGVAMGGLATGAAGLSGCERLPGAGPTSGDGAQAIDPAITETTLAEAEKLHALEFTSAERQMMLEGLEQNLESLARLRAIKMPNDLAPAMVFEPRVPGRRYRSQKNRLTLLDEPVPPLPEDRADIAFASVKTQGQWLRTGKITARTLTEIYLERIGAMAPMLECFITVTPDLALAQADRADADFADGKDRGPLQGIPYGLKDLADVEDTPTTWGATPYKDRVAQTDAGIVTRLERGRAVLLGKTTCGALAYGDVWFDGKTRNPWNTDEGSSGSSAGSASATAAGLCSFSIGTETLGSIVSPSERCGTTGLRPTFGRVSRSGFMALCWSLDKVGPICRSVEDTAIVLSQINGFDRRDPSAQRFGFTSDSTIDIKGMRVGYVPEWFENGDETDRAALAALRDLGVEPQPFSMPTIAFDSLIQIVLVEAAAAFADLTLDNTDDMLVWQDPEAWPNSFRQARFMTAVDYVQIDRLRRQLMIDMADAFDGFDAVIGPHYAGGMLLATNCTGHPQLALRAGFTQSPTRQRFGNGAGDAAGVTHRVPRGISLWGNLFGESALIALGAQLERVLNVAEERPVL
ncbi:MAG: amidase [Pseudomonadota bacterium]